MTHVHGASEPKINLMNSEQCEWVDHKIFTYVHIICDCAKQPNQLFLMVQNIKSNERKKYYWYHNERNALIADRRCFPISFSFRTVPCSTGRIVFRIVEYITIERIASDCLTILCVEIIKWNNSDSIIIVSEKKVSKHKLQTYPCISNVAVNFGWSCEMGND